MARITLEQVVKDYPNPAKSGRSPSSRTVRAVNGVSLDLADGEFLTVLGPSGCGKTTLLRLVAGLETLTSGRIVLAERDVSALPPEERELAMVFQRDALLPHLSARENIALGLRLRGENRTDITKRVREVADLFQLGGQLDRRPGALSGGERQRTALARAFVRRPEAFLLDEPFAALDAPLRVELRGQLFEIHRRLGATILHVTHDQAEAMAVGHRVAVLDRGVLQQVAEPAVLWRRPENAFVAGFIGSPPMNLWHGTLAHQGGAWWFQAEADASAEPIALGLTEAQGAFLGGSARRRIILGLGSDHIVSEAAAVGRSFPFGTEVTATARLVECLGADALIRWSCGGEKARLATRMPWATAPRVGDSARLIFDMGHAQFFDEATGRRVDLPEPRKEN